MDCEASAMVLHLGFDVGVFGRGLGLLKMG